MPASKVLEGGVVAAQLLVRADGERDTKREPAQPCSPGGQWATICERRRNGSPLGELALSPKMHKDTQFVSGRCAAGRRSATRCTRRSAERGRRTGVRKSSGLATQDPEAHATSLRPQRARGARGDRATTPNGAASRRTDAKGRCPPAWAKARCSAPCTAPARASAVTWRPPTCPVLLGMRCQRTGKL